MYIFSLDNEDVKKFMNLLLRETAFDVFRVHSGEITTCCTFKIDGTMNKDFFAETPDGGRCPWSALRPVVFDIIKGKKLPKLFKLVLAVPEDKLPLLHENCKEAYLNINYENGKISFVTGTMQNEFRMDKAQDEAFENYIKKLFKKLELTAVSL
jgi:hypothetical protein